MATSLLELDGTFGEGGGQILRTSLALSLLTGRPFHLRNLRARRDKPGLQPQHLMSVRAAATVGHAQLRGASLHSTDLVFEPGEVVAGKYSFAIGTAGATGLVLHTVYLPLALRGLAASALTLTGGTHVRTSPIFPFLDTTWRRYVELMGLQIELDLHRPGFYPRGGGVVTATVHPCPQIKRISLYDAQSVTTATVISAVARLPEGIAQRQAKRARHRLASFGLEVAVREESWDAGPGTMLAIVLDTRPVPTFFYGLGERGKPAERVADEAVEQALAYLRAGGGVDVHSADQLVLPLALAAGPSSYRAAAITPHLVTNVAVIRRFIERDIVCEGEPGAPGMVRIT